MCTGMADTDLVAIDEKLTVGQMLRPSTEELDTVKPMVCEHSAGQDGTADTQATTAIAARVKSSLVANTYSNEMKARRAAATIGIAV